MILATMYGEPECVSRRVESERLKVLTVSLGPRDGNVDVVYATLSLVSTRIASVLPFTVTTSPLAIGADVTLDPWSDDILTIYLAGRTISHGTCRQSVGSSARRA